MASPSTSKSRANAASWSDPQSVWLSPGNDIEGLRAVRAAAPDAWFLAPGIGAQGGRADEAFAAGSRADGLGILIVAARSVAQAGDPGSGRAGAPRRDRGLPRQVPERANRRFSAERTIGGGSPLSASSTPSFRPAALS